MNEELIEDVYESIISNMDKNYYVDCDEDGRPIVFINPHYIGNTAPPEYHGSTKEKRKIFKQIRIIINLINSGVSVDNLMLHEQEKIKKMIEVYKNDDIDKIAKIIKENGELDNSDINAIESLLPKIEEEHNPQKLSIFLQKFSSNEKLKYSNHTWDSTLSYDDFMKDLKKEFDEMSDELEILSPTLYENINKFLFIDDEKYVGWSSQIIKEEITKGVLPNNIELDTTNQDFKTFIEAIDNFKSLLVIKQSDKNLKLLKRFTKIKKDLQLDIKIDLNNLKKDKIDKFFTDTIRFEKALKLILEDINAQGEETKKDVIIEANTIEDGEIVEIKIIHLDSSSSKTADALKETINDNGGTFESIYNNLRSVCDWSIETTCQDEGRYRIDYLYPEIDNTKPHCTKIEDSIKGFTHILRFYV